MSNVTTGPIRKLLVANRGEIAVRVIRTCREMGIATVAVYSEIDRHALHVRMADEAVLLGPAPSAESYLRDDRILEACQRLQVDAVHPGYGFLSENAEFARACSKAGVIFVGPSPEAIVQMGDKTRARQKMIAAGVPVVPGTEEPIEDIEAAIRIASDIGFPIMLKAAAGGGGKGMRLVKDPAEFERSFHAAAREAKAAFGDDRVYLEKFILEPHHVEVQVFGDTHGNVVHLFERECSIQRRHQKVIEESPSPFISEATRQKMTAAAVQATAAVHYVGAGTCEFLVDCDQNFFFLEMNTRLQVEHPVTESVTGVDLVEWQLRVAMGEKLPAKQEELSQKGWAMEARIYAEDPWNRFMPSPGKIVGFEMPTGPGVRLDLGVYPGYTIPLEYDPMIGKMIVRGTDRAQVIRRLRRALEETRILGIKTNLAFHHALLENEDFLAGKFDTGFLDQVDVMAQYPHNEQRAQDGRVAALILAYESACRNGAAGRAQHEASSQRWRWSYHPGCRRTL